MTEKQKNTPDTEFTVRANDAFEQVSDKARELLEQGNIRRFIVRKENGEELVNITLTIAIAIAVGISLVLTPVILVLMAIGGIFAKLSVEIAREISPEQVVDMTEHDDTNNKVKNGV